MSENEQFLAEHRAEYPDCEEPLMSGRCKCGHSRLYTCVPHDRLFIVQESGCTCTWVES